MEGRPRPPAQAKFTMENKKTIKVGWGKCTFTYVKEADVVEVSPARGDRYTITRETATRMKKDGWYKEHICPFFHIV